MAVNLRACLPDETTRNACVDAFTTAFTPPRRRGAVVVAGDDRARAAYAAQCEARDAEIADVRHANGELAYADIVVGEATEIERCVRELPLDVATLRGSAEKLDVLKRRVRSWCTLMDWDGEPPRWENEVAWRLGRLYDLRFAKDRESARASSRKRLSREVEDLLPATGVDTNGCNARRSIDSVRQVALPSVLESLRHGFDYGEANGHRATALRDGLPERVLNQRRVLLKTQQRMHPEIAAFSHEHIYDGEALHTPSSMESERKWAYPRYRHRSVWIDVRGGFHRQTNSNVGERVTVLDELRLFEDWAKQHPRPGGGALGGGRSHVLPRPGTRYLRPPATFAARRVGSRQDQGLHRGPVSGARGGHRLHQLREPSFDEFSGVAQSAERCPDESALPTGDRRKPRRLAPLSQRFA